MTPSNSRPLASARTDGLLETPQLRTKYAVTTTQGDVERLATMFTLDATYSAFGSTYTPARFRSWLRPEFDVAAGAAPEPDVAAGAAPEPDVATGAALEPG